MTNGLEKAKKLTKAQIENLQHVRDYGRAKPRSPSGYWCRSHGLSDFVWLYEDGSIATTDEKPPVEGAYLVKVLGERLTLLGLSSLQSLDTGGGGA
jgi:hypothetical protein